MSNPYSAYCADFYINQRLNLKMDLPMRRDTVLSLFDRVRRELPDMQHFRRYENELALETRPAAAGSPSMGIMGVGNTPGSGLPENMLIPQRWMAVRRTSIRAGCVNPENDEAAFALHSLILDAAPYFLDVSPLDVDHLELLFGFDLPASGNHDAAVFHALMHGSPLSALAEPLVSGGDTPKLTPVDCQPLLGLALNDEGTLQAHFEIKTRSGTRAKGDGRDESISVYLILRRYGPFTDMKALPAAQMALRTHAGELIEHRVVPHLLMPLRDSLAAGH